MTFYRLGRRARRRLGVLSGSFNPPTRAHLALGGAALDAVEEVIFALPKRLPHKTYEGVGLEARLEMLCEAVESHPRFSVATTEGGLFLEIAEECRVEYGEQIEVAFICGRDAAERIVGWDYGEGPAIPDQLARYSLLVATRQGRYAPPPELANRIQPLRLNEDLDAYSATRVRNAISSSETWETLVPPSIIELVKRNYAR